MDENMIIYNTTLSEYNTYKGASNQQAASVVTITSVSMTAIFKNAPWP